MSGKKSWRLGRTLSRNVTVRPIEDEDVKYAWAAYKKDALGQMGFSPNLDAASFKSAFEMYVLTNAQAAWTVIAENRGKQVPVGFALGQWGPYAAFMFVSGIAWFPWATCRNIVEGTVALFNKLRKEMAVLGFASDEHKPLYEACCMHGIMRRVGTSHMFGKPAAVFEGKR